MAVHMTSVPTLADLKNAPGGNDNVVMTLGLLTPGDNKGKLYFWDSLNTTAEDTTNWNVVQVTGMSVGRYITAFTRVLNLPHGTLFIANGKKEFFTNNAVVSASGDALVNLTMDNTTDGAAIFNVVLFDDSKATINTTTHNDAVSSCRKVLSANLKQLTHLFFKGNNTTLGGTLTALLGAVITGLQKANAGTTVVFRVEGT